MGVFFKDLYLCFRDLESLKIGYLTVSMIAIFLALSHLNTTAK